ncbi:DinB family protein [Chitinophaga solisilvae]|uniref:DinB family protein n=1 Tax=Chitinophaga solisilvae TaxID=1233460 RepID=UPI001F185BBC|nr:DinB family protein [Chitinophaga solisilvae]
MMETTRQIAKHFRDVHFGGNWTSVNLKDTLADISWQQAVTKVHNLNTIAVLVFHVNYYVSAMLKVLQGTPLKAHDKYSFDLPPLTSEAAWEELVAKTLTEAEQMAVLIEQLDDEQLGKDFADAKYGSYHRNLLGVTEHTHYHLGQIAVIKKMLNEK